MSARLFQGARISIGGAQIKDSLEDHTVGELAAIIGRYMYENAVETNGVRVCPAGIPRAIEELWPYQAPPTKQVRLTVGSILRSKGFRVLTGGPGPGGFLGYRVPDELPTEWPTEIPSVKTVGDVPTKTMPDQPVKTGWQCRAGCKRMFRTVETRDAHERKHTMDRPKNGRTSPTEDRDRALKDAVETMPGLLAHEYRDLLNLDRNGMTWSARKLVNQGSIARTGSRASTRYWPAEPREKNEMIEKKEYTPAPKPEKAAQPVKPSANGLPLEGSMLLVNGKLYRVKLEPVD